MSSLVTKLSFVAKGVSNSLKPISANITSHLFFGHFPPKRKLFSSFLSQTQTSAVNRSPSDYPSPSNPPFPSQPQPTPTPTLTLPSPPHPQPSPISFLPFSPQTPIICHDGRVWAQSATFPQV